MSLARSAGKLIFSITDLAMRAPSGPRLLIYHRVTPGASQQLAVEPEDFEWQLDWLTTHRQLVDLETALTRWHEPNAGKLVAVTFDDGFRDVFTTAYPLLAARSVPFTLYLATEQVERGETGEDPESLTWSQVAEMMSDGLATVGAHTHTHRDLRRAGTRVVRDEIEQSDRVLAERLSLEPRHFAYPWGYWSEAGDSLIRDRYDSAVLGAPVARRGDFSPHLIHRFPVQLSDGRRWFRRRLEGGLLMEERLRRGIRGYRGP